ncbi:MAG: chromosome segregation protein SMC [Deltaproteobacteria bacterium RBG_16_49_23]|nr:MAG: chromosome segregation protein SMC [Deltaproteobacteria bacterium RBG_16_49_23]
MKIKSLEMTGFKSFVDRLQIFFPEGVTTIVGPNGCGKSNIVDAILWAIGERSAKHLRGKLMEDVIFGGTDGRKPLGMAEVSLTFSNEDGTAPVEYQPYSEITITRRLFRSGESEFLINRTPCRLRDVIDLFLDTGIGVNGYSIVEQGRVEHLIHANPQDRRFLIEEAGGIAKYKERKRLALMKMEATQQNLVRIQDIISEVKRQIITLERQVKRAEEFKAMRKEVREIELRFALQEYAELSEKGEAARGYLKALLEREAVISAQMAEREASVEGMRLKSLAEEERLRTLQQEIYDLNQRIQKIENEIEFSRREKESLQRQEAQMLEEIGKGLQAWRETRRERRRTEQTRRELEKGSRENEEIVKDWEVLYNEFRGTYQEVSDQLEAEKGRLIDTLTQLTSLRNRQSHLEERREDLQKRIRAHGKESEEVSAGLARLIETLSKVEKEREVNLSIQTALQEEKERWAGELEQLREVFRIRQSERFGWEERLRQDRSRYFSLKELQENYEGFEKGVKSLLFRKREEQDRWDRMFGVVADILEPEPPYEIPLEAVLGQRLQYLMVADEGEARGAIEFLKKESLGRGSFIPVGVSGKKQKEPSSPLELEEGPTSLMRFVKVKEGFSAIAEFLIGEVGVVDHLEKALNWMKQEGAFETLVTLQGEVVERTGVISGGSRDQGLGILERRREIRELEKKIEGEEEGCRKALEEEGRIHQGILEREVQLEHRKREIQEKEIELLHQDRDLEGVNKEISQFRQRAELLQFEGEELREEEKEIEEEMKTVLVQMEREEAAKKEKENELQSLKKTVEEVREGMEELGGRITEKKVYLASIEEKQRGMEVQLLNLSENIRALREQIIQRARGIRASREEEASLRERIDQREKELEGLIENHRVNEGGLSHQREKVEALSNEWKEAEASSRYLRQELEDIRQKSHGEEIRVSEVQLKLQHLQDSMRERYGATLSTSIGMVPEEFPKEEMSKRLAELKGGLEGFGEVNLLALEEYQELKQRHDFLTEQQNDLQQALDTLKKAIVRINRTTTKRFLETFQLVNEKFREVFTRLFKGGQASLILMDEQDPSTSGVDIIAQPPGKKLQNIDLLSGGEKALVATALLFGLFMIRPTPFCLLDEMDAPLDDANINRFIEMVKEFSKTSQFILITHNKKTMEMANTLYGITMETPGVSKVVSVRLN